MLQPLFPSTEDGTAPCCIRMPLQPRLVCISNKPRCHVVAGLPASPSALAAFSAFAGLIICAISSVPCLSACLRANVPPASSLHERPVLYLSTRLPLLPLQSFAAR